MQPFFVTNPTLIVHCFTRLFSKLVSNAWKIQRLIFMEKWTFFSCKSNFTMYFHLPKISQKTCSISYSLVLNHFKFWIVQDATEAYTGFLIRVRASSFNAKMVRHTLKILQHLLKEFLSVSEHFGALCI